MREIKIFQFVHLFFTVSSTSIGFISKVLNKVLESDEPQDIEDVGNQKLQEEDMLCWEREHLVNDTNRELIKTLWPVCIF